MGPVLSVSVGVLVHAENVGCYENIAILLPSNNMKRFGFKLLEVYTIHVGPEHNKSIICKCECLHLFGSIPEINFVLALAFYPIAVNSRERKRK